MEASMQSRYSSRSLHGQKASLVSWQPEMEIDRNPECVPSRSAASECFPRPQENSPFPRLLLLDAANPGNGSVPDLFTLGISVRCVCFEGRQIERNSSTSQFGSERRTPGESSSVSRTDGQGGEARRGTWGVLFLLRAFGLCIIWAHVFGP